MKLQNPFLLCICLALVLYCSKKSDSNKPNPKPSALKHYKITVNRGAFHYDRFELTSEKITFLPESESKHPEVKYNKTSETKLDTDSTKKFFKEIEKKGFWKLKDNYKAGSSCTSELKVTLKKEGKSKTVICDDFERDCPDLIKYIDKKAVEFEGNDLKRIYLQG